MDLGSMKIMFKNIIRRISEAHGILGGISVLWSSFAMISFAGCSQSDSSTNPVPTHPLFENSDISFAYIIGGRDDHSNQMIFDTSYYRVNIKDNYMKIGCCRSKDSLANYELCGTHASGMISYSSSYPDITAYLLLPDKDWVISGIRYQVDTLTKYYISPLQPTGALDDSGYALSLIHIYEPTRPY